MFTMKEVAIMIVVVSVLSQLVQKSGSQDMFFEVEQSLKDEAGDHDITGYFGIRKNYSFEILQQQGEYSYPQHRDLIIWKQLDKQFQDLLLLIKPSAEERVRMENSFRIVNEIVTSNFAGSRCDVFGSVGSDLWVRKQADLDIGITTFQKNVDHDYQEQVVQEIGEVLEKVRYLFQQKCKLSLGKNR
eukprot:TRINITY_DN20563_c0_g1_i3.p1 TRINITY_DN20563_c0_g1~~TRINITY_DN20563_c0_g1_i3.p1  ORF type:complete len:187 (+),score=12.81 TRINITY_DN20563_c0_g1_i3:90-650(+)